MMYATSPGRLLKMIAKSLLQFTLHILCEGGRASHHRMGVESVSSLKGLGFFPASPSTPPAAACWAELCRAKGAGFNASNLYSPSASVSRQMLLHKTPGSPAKSQYPYRRVPTHSRSRCRTSIFGPA